MKTSSTSPAQDPSGRRDLVHRKWPIDRGIRLLEDVELVFKEAHTYGNRILDPDHVAVPTTRGYCPLPWTMMTIHWDGDCSLCCLDYNKEVVVGNVRDTSLEEVFTGPAIARVRQSFARGIVERPLCQTCLGGVRDRRTGAWVRPPAASRSQHLLRALRKYGAVPSLEHALQTLGARAAAGLQRLGLRRGPDRGQSSKGPTSLNAPPEDRSSAQR